MSHTHRAGRRGCRLFAWGQLLAASFAFAAEPVSVHIQELSALSIYPESSAPAVVVSLNDAPIAAQVDAPVMQLPVRVGDAVKAGGGAGATGLPGF